MKKKLIIIASVLVLGVSLSFSAQKFNAAKPVDKNINVEVYKTASYISPAYANTFATLQVTVVRVNGAKRDTAWQHTFEQKELKEYPSSDNPTVEKITIPNVNDKKEKLEIYYRLTYDSKGSILNFLNTTIMGEGQQTGKLNIQI